MQDYVLGVDGGNTKTVALVATTDGRILGAGRSGNSDIYPNQNAVNAVNVIEAAVQQALQQAGVKRAAITAAAYSLAGADWPEDYDEYRDELIRRGLGRQITVYNDAIGALRAGSPDGTGVGIAAGTGAAIGARNASGELWHGSYWQDSLGGLEIGYQALHAVRHANLGLEAPTSLTAVVLRYFNKPSYADVLRMFTMRGATPPGCLQVSRLAPYVLNEAANGDEAARRIVTAQGRRMAEFAFAAARQVRMEQTPFHLILNGGIFRHASTLLPDTIERTAREHGLIGEVAVSRYEPVAGALLLAYETLGLPIGPAVYANLDETLPPSTTFETQTER
jgi:N-acetylglucosamine kinase-like BadF-type ATPase